MRILLFLVYFPLLGHFLSCPILNVTHQQLKLSLELEYSKLTLSSSSTSPSSTSRPHITMLFGHLHHAGGTAVCQLARKNVITNLKSNCNHPHEFSKTIIPPTRGTIQDQLTFQQTTSWNFYAVELSMPTQLLYDGPFLYSIIIRHPYLLLLSQYRRAKAKFQFEGTIPDLISYQFSRVHATFNLSSIPLTNYYRGIAGFILGKFSSTSISSKQIYEEVIQRLDYFSVILLTENMSYSAQQFALKFSWNITEYGQSLVNSHGDVSELLDLARSLSDEEKKFIQWYSEIDLQIYKYCRCRIERDIKNLLKLHPNQAQATMNFQHKLPKYSPELQALEKIIHDNSH